MLPKEEIAFVGIPERIDALSLLEPGLELGHVIIDVIITFVFVSEPGIILEDVLVICYFWGLNLDWLSGNLVYLENQVINHLNRFGVC